MAPFKELIKSFPKTREYVRDFFVYGFKTREEFQWKSPRTYDNERRRLESWLGPFIRRDMVSGGQNISLAIDSNLLDTNPLFQVWKTKSFTDNDIVLHFLILDFLQDSSPMTAEQITDALIEEYGMLFDLQTVRRKRNHYVEEGLLYSKKDGKKRVYYSDITLSRLLAQTEEILNALQFYQLCGPFGIIGDELLEQNGCRNHLFRVKHCFFVHTLEDEILLDILQAIKNKVRIVVHVRGRQHTPIIETQCIPLKIFVSTKSGRRYLASYEETPKRFHCFRLDAIKEIRELTPAPDYDLRKEQLEKNLHLLWGVSFSGNSRQHLQRVSMTLHIQEPAENYILNRLENEGRGGTVTKLSPDTYLYETEVFDANEMIPWIRTFIGRIIRLECSNKSLEQRFHRDLAEMYRMYDIQITR